MKILSVIIRVMNVGFQKSSASVTSFWPFCDCSSKFERPKNIRSSKSCHIQAFQDNLRAYFGQFSNRFQLLHLEIMVVYPTRGKRFPWSTEEPWQREYLLWQKTRHACELVCEAKHFEPTEALRQSCSSSNMPVRDTTMVSSMHTSPVKTRKSWFLGLPEDHLSRSAHSLGCGLKVDKRTPSPKQRLQFRVWQRCTRVWYGMLSHFSCFPFCLHGTRFVVLPPQGCILTLNIRPRDGSAMEAGMEYETISPVPVDPLIPVDCRLESSAPEKNLERETLECSCQHEHGHGQRAHRSTRVRLCCRNNDNKVEVSTGKPSTGSLKRSSPPLQRPDPRPPSASATAQTSLNKTEVRRDDSPRPMLDRLLTCIGQILNEFEPIVSFSRKLQWLTYYMWCQRNNGSGQHGVACWLLFVCNS